uniref:Ubiquitin-like domain-containing protein n=1 Tax=Fagus sylvatica TaxID=28930 RepID=A0A2N9IH90_FAGSY
MPVVLPLKTTPDLQPQLSLYGGGRRRWYGGWFPAAVSGCQGCQWRRAVQYTMGYELGSPSQDGRDEDDEEEYEDGGGGNRFLGFMFGNVDNSGDLDVDYLDEVVDPELFSIACDRDTSVTALMLFGNGNLRRRKIVLVSWCCMCKVDGESVDHLLIHCPLVKELLWDTVLTLFGMHWVMPRKVRELLDCWHGGFGQHCHSVIWKAISHCLMWCLWWERNMRSFEGSEMSISDLKLLFLPDASNKIVLLYYFIEDAKEHLAALADKLGPSLTDIDVWKSQSCVLGCRENGNIEKSPRTPADAAEQELECELVEKPLLGFKLFTECPGLGTGIIDFIYGSLIYSVHLDGNGADKFCWNQMEKRGFSVQSFYRCLSPPSMRFPWKGIWKPKVPPHVAFFTWTAVLAGESVDHLLIHCLWAKELWDTVLSLFGVSWVMPRQKFKDTELGVPDLKLLFFWTLFDWMNATRLFSFSSLQDFLDYDEKAEDAVDYEDFDEQYEGPEIQAATEEDHLLPKKEYFATEVSLASLKPTSVFDDENYDEELEQELEVVDNNFEVQTTPSTGELGEIGVVSKGEKSLEDDLQLPSIEAENLDVDVEEFQEVPQNQEGSLDEKGSTPLPVLCIEDGMVILRFSEIFGIHKSLKKREKRDRRYSIPKDRYKIMDMSDIVEEDEEQFLKDAGQGYSFMKQAHVIELEGSVFGDDKPEVTTFGVLQEATSLASGDDGQRKDSCLSAEPMKDGVMGNFSAGWQSPRCPGFYPLDQQDWEKGILWDNSPVASDNSVESCEISGPDLEASVVSETELETRPQNPGSEPQMEPDNDHHSLLRSSPDLLEPFGSRNASPPFSLRSYHPQLLRLESCLEVDISNHADGGKETVSEELHQSDGLRCFNKLTSQYKDILEGSWLDEIIWETDRPIEKPKLILDLQDEQMLFEILDSKDAKHLGLHARAMIITRSVKSRNGDSFEQPGHGGQSGWRSVANDKHYSNRKSSQKIKSNSEKRTVHGVKVFHSQPALMLQTMKLKLSNSSKESSMRWSFNTPYSSPRKNVYHPLLQHLIVIIYSESLVFRARPDYLIILTMGLELFIAALGWRAGPSSTSSKSAKWEPNLLFVTIVNKLGIPGLSQSFSVLACDPQCKELANFHRPKALWYPHDNGVAVREQGKLPTKRPMKIIVKSLGGKGSKIHVVAEETITSVKAKASKKLGCHLSLGVRAYLAFFLIDFKLSEMVKLFYLGKELEDHGSLASQNVQPNSLLHLVRTKIHLSPRAQKLPGENKSLRPPGAFKKKSELSVKDGHVFLMEIVMLCFYGQSFTCEIWLDMQARMAVGNCGMMVAVVEAEMALVTTCGEKRYCEERPLLLGNAGMGARLCTYYQKSAPDDQTGSLLRNGNSSLGHVIVLDPTDKSPYLGDIKPGCSQSSLETNMYRAPIFTHKVPSTDYLLVRSAKGKLSIRRIDRINVVGQQEPLMEVISPGSKALQTYMTNRLLVYMAREFRASEKRHLLPCIRADELPGQFPYLSEAIIRKKLKEHANLQLFYCILYSSKYFKCICTIPEGAKWSVDLG